MPYSPRYRRQISSQRLRIERGVIELVADISDWKYLFFVSREHCIVTYESVQITCDRKSSLQVGSFT